LADLSSSNPIRARPPTHSADPVQKQDPGGWVIASGMRD
jgi:hypothetical protein